MNGTPAHTLPQTHELVPKSTKKETDPGCNREKTYKREREKTYKREREKTYEVRERRPIIERE